jgi:hypothetical protein
MPDFEELPEFGKNINRARGKVVKERVSVGEKNPITVEQKVKKPYTGIVYKKEYNGITLIGTDRVMAKSDKKGSIAPVDEDGKPFTGPTKTEVKETEKAAEEQPEQEPEKKSKSKERLKPKTALEKKKKKEEDSDEEGDGLEDISYYDKRTYGYNALYNYLTMLIRNIKDYNFIIKREGQKGIDEDSIMDLIGKVVNYKPADINDNRLIAFMFKDFAAEDDDGFALNVELKAMEQLEKDNHEDEFIDIARRTALVPGVSKEIKEKYQWAY